MELTSSSSSFSKVEGSNLAHIKKLKVIQSFWNFENWVDSDSLQFRYNWMPLWMYYKPLENLAPKTLLLLRKIEYQISNSDYLRPFNGSCDHENLRLCYCDI